MLNNFYSTATGIAITQKLFTLIILGVLFLVAVPSQWWLLSIFVYFLTGCLGITITFHRYLTHKSFSMPKWMEYLFSFFAAMGGTGSSIGWVAVHKTHHRESDTELDPHSPHTRGLKLLLSSYKYEFNHWDSRRLLEDKFHLYLHAYYYIIFIIWGALLFLIDWKIGIFGFIVPVTIQIWISNLSNWGNHLFGYKNYDTDDHSKNTWWLALLAWGEGWHNNHHAQPWHYSFQRKWWEFDISAYTIQLICLLTGNWTDLKERVKKYKTT